MQLVYVRTPSGGLFAKVPQGDEAVLGAGGERRVGGVEERHAEDLVAVSAGVSGTDSQGL